MQQLTPSQLKQWTDEGRDFVLVDVREEWEHEAYNIGGRLISMSELGARQQEIPRDKEVVVYCEKGIRSVIAIQRLEAAGYTNLFNLSGGMKGWRK
jgi:rhodanese-related sulfurtransferase